MITLSIGMMVKNEEDNLERTLKSLEPILKSLSSELIIVDTGSTDHTVEIARKFTDKVYLHPWEDDFAKMRNRVIGYAKGQWFMTLDADEVFEDCQPIIGFLQSKQSQQYNSATIMFKNITSKDGRDFVKGPVIRLFRMHPSFKYSEAIHEQPVYRLPTMFLDAKILHYGYINDDTKLMEIKFERYVTLLKKELDKNPNNVYYWHQLSKSYLLHKDIKDAVECARKSYELAKEGHANKSQMVFVYAGLLSALFNAIQLEDLAKYALEAIDQYPDFPDHWFYAAKAMRKTHSISETIPYYEGYLKYAGVYETTSAAKNVGSSQNTLYKVNEMRYDLVGLYIAEKDYKSGLQIYKEIDDPIYAKKLCINMPELFIEVDHTEELKKTYQEIESENDQADISKMFHNLEKVYTSIFEEKQIEFESQMTEGLGIYSIVCVIRRKLRQNEVVELDFENIRSHMGPFRYLPPSVGEVLYCILRYPYAIERVDLDFGFVNLETGFRFAINKHKEFVEIAYQWLVQNEPEENYLQLTWTSALLKALLEQAKKINDLQVEMFERYVHTHEKLLRLKYNLEMIEKIGISVFNNAEEAFVYLYAQALKQKTENQSQYISGIRKAVAVYPAYVAYIEAAISRMRQELEADQIATKQSEELFEMKGKFKSEINKMIERGQLDEADSLINLYGESFTEDDDILGMKGLIRFLKQDYQQALKYFYCAIESNPENIDVLYNIAYIERELGDIRNALGHYEKLLSLTTQKELIEEINAEVQLCNQLLQN